MPATKECHAPTHVTGGGGALSGASALDGIAPPQRESVATSTPELGRANVAAPHLPPPACSPAAPLRLLPGCRARLCRPATRATHPSCESIGVALNGGRGVPHLKQFCFDAKTFEPHRGQGQSPGRTLPPPRALLKCIRIPWWAMGIEPLGRR